MQMPRHAKYLEIQAEFTTKPRTHSEQNFAGVLAILSPLHNE